MCVCVCVCVCVCARARVRMCVCACVHARAHLNAGICIGLCKYPGLSRDGAPLIIYSSYSYCDSYAFPLPLRKSLQRATRSVTKGGNSQCPPSRLGVDSAILVGL